MTSADAGLAHIGASRRLGPRNIRLSSTWVVPSLVVVLVAVLSVTEPRFLGQGNLTNLSRNASYLVIVGSGQMLVMILGGLDLSIGVVVALSSVTTAIAMSHTLAWWPGYDLLAIVVSVVAALTVSALTGLANGLCVARTNASAFMVTLGMFSIIGGLVYYVTAGIPIYGMPPVFSNNFGRGSLFNVPYVVFIALVIVGIGLLIQKYTRLGRFIYAIGGNATAARASGIPIFRLTVLAYVFCSLMAGITGVLITARIGAGQANLGSEFMLQSIGVAVIAGVSLRGGVGRVEMLLFSSIFLTIFANAMNLIRIDSKIQTIVFGVVLLAAVFADRHSRSGGVDD
jgi:ribose transport system permease protein